MSKLKKKANNFSRKGRSKSQRVAAKMIIKQHNKGHAGGPETTSKKPNPFDLIFAKRQKNGNQINNKWTNKDSRRSNAGEIRKRTLDVEFQRRRKANQILDRRIGQHSIELSEEAKAQKRFLFQQKKLVESRTSATTTTTKTERSEQLNTTINEDNSELITANKKHIRWKDLAPNEVNQNQINSDEDLEEGLGEQDEDDSNNQRKERKNRREVIAQLVSQDRRLRAIKSMLRDEQEEETERLDKCFQKMRTSGLLKLATGDETRHDEQQNRDQNYVEMVQPLEANKMKERELTETDTYDLKYHELQFQPPTQLLSPLSKTMAEKTSSVKQSSSRLTVDFYTAIKQWEQLVDDHPTKFNKEWIERMDRMLQEQLYPAFKKSPHVASRYLLEKLEKMHEQLIDNAQCSKHSPTFEQIIFIQIISLFYPTQLHFHPLSTPTLAFSLELLAESRIQDVPHCGRLIFLCALLFKWTGETGKYLPEVIATLLGALQLCVHQPDTHEQFPTISFPVSHPHREMLFVEQKLLEQLPTEEKLPIFSLFKSDKTQKGEEIIEILDDEQTCRADERLRLLIIRLLLSTIRKYADKYTSSCRSAYNAIFARFHQFLLRLPLDNYPVELADEAKSVREFLAQKLRELAPVTQLRISEKPQKALTMLEPRFEEHFNPERPSKINGKNRVAALRERERQWAKRAKREKRGAIKELRKDAAHMASLYAEQQRKIRQERDEKTKRILQTLEVQESEYKKLQAISGKKI